MLKIGQHLANRQYYSSLLFFFDSQCIFIMILHALSHIMIFAVLDVQFGF